MRAEIYSFGLVLWSVASQREPFHAQSAIQIDRFKRDPAARMPLDDVRDNEFAELISECTSPVMLCSRYGCIDF